ncbi:uncharacterized protein KY384_001331 [Bacidia gigantensis]|uniref:uncharacterized protein n=1 Tax=Bacidia gigantensis TaxID=2732470 RepID=UPI001D0395A6|nr:uncharacterized protein KY384_001331 [Bacidia gigantensis]KAG8533591.1 hypothetical protein KY384_001331 [Bacidia gigantensis]
MVMSDEGSKEFKDEDVTDFRFFELPSELRLKILSLIIESHVTIDLQPNMHRNAPDRLNLFLTSKRMHAVVAGFFFGSNTFRIFPTHGRYFGPKVAPLLARLPTKYREMMTSLELRLGPGWGNPPDWWKVHNTNLRDYGDDWLGLGDMKDVNRLMVFVEVDPNQDVFKTFRRSRVSFTKFSRSLLRDIMFTLPGLTHVAFDAWPSVKLDGVLMCAMMEETQRKGIEVHLSRELEMQRKYASYQLQRGQFDTTLAV